MNYNDIVKKYLKIKTERDERREKLRKDPALEKVMKNLLDSVKKTKNTKSSEAVHGYGEQG